jgi:dihydroflavonol-4-reductase
MSGERYLVTGAGGFIGRHLAGSLAAAGHDVRAVDVRPCPTALVQAGVRYEQADIRDGPRMRVLMNGVDVVLHLASVHLEVNESEGAYQAVNVAAVEELIAASKAAGVRRFVHTSSVGVFGHVAVPPAAEGAPKAPQNLYERSKLAGELAARTQADRHAVDLVILRPAWVYGPGCPRTEKLLRAVRNGRFLYVGAGRNLRHPLYIEDLLEAYRLAVSVPAAAGETYNIAGPKALTVRHLVEAAAQAQGVAAPRLSLPRTAFLGMALAAELGFGILGRSPPFSRRTLAFFENDNSFSIDKARVELGFQPRISLPEGLTRTLEKATPAVHV